MTRHDAGPQRSASVGSYLRQTRLLAALAVAGLVAGIASDATGVRFWIGHPLLAGLAANVIVVLLSVALLNEVIQNRSRRRWRVLAQYVMFELTHNARLIWTGVLNIAGLLPAGASESASLEAGSRIVRDAEALGTEIRRMIEDDDRRRLLYTELARCASASDEVVGRWAAVMLNADAYAEIIDRHVELASDLAWLKGLVADCGTSFDLRRRRARFSRAIRQGNDIDEQWLADRVVMITQLAEELERGTFKIALRVVPVEWWQSRLGSDVPNAES